VGLAVPLAVVTEMGPVVAVGDTRAVTLETEFSL